MLSILILPIMDFLELYKAYLTGGSLRQHMDERFRNDERYVFERRWTIWGTTITKQYPDFETNIPAYAGGGTSAAATTATTRSV
ncbi:MAG: hypothetical protein WA364_16955 [Candidatus Nitrosopolaris sp.]